MMELIKEAPAIIKAGTIPADVLVAGLTALPTGLTKPVEEEGTAEPVGSFGKLVSKFVDIRK